MRLQVNVENRGLYVYYHDNEGREVLRKIRYIAAEYLDNYEGSNIQRGWYGGPVDVEGRDYDVPAFDELFPVNDGPPPFYGEDVCREYVEHHVVEFFKDTDPGATFWADV